MPNEDLFDALEVAFNLISKLEIAHDERCEIPDSAWDLVAFLDWSPTAPWN